MTEWKKQAKGSGIIHTAEGIPHAVVDRRGFGAKSAMGQNVTYGDKVFPDVESAKRFAERDCQFSAEYIDALYGREDKGRALIERIFAVQSAKFGDRQTRTDGVVAHIHKEADEAKAHPGDLVEWADIILLAIDGYRRNGGKADELLPLLAKKIAIVEAREYPDPYATPDDVALEHDRTPAPETHLLASEWTDQDRAKAWRDTFDAMHQRAMRAEKCIRDNWLGGYWRSVDFSQANEVRIILADASLPATEGQDNG